MGESKTGDLYSVHNGISKGKQFFGKGYTWNEMYDLLHLKCDSGFFSFLGEFVHGLSTSNIAFEPNVIDFEPIYGAAIALLGRLYEFINNYYADDINIVQAKAITGLADIGMPQKYVDYLLNELSNLKEKGRY